MRPGTTSSYSLRSTARPSCCGASTATPPGSGPSRRTRSPTCSPSTWGSPRGCLPQDAVWWNQGETGQVVALWRPPQVWSVALQREAFKPPARLRLPMPGLVFVCSPGRAPWVYAATERPTDPEQHLFRAPAFNVFSDGRVCPGSHRFPEEVGLIPEVLLPVLLLPYRRHAQPLEEAPRKPGRAMGGNRWNRLSTRWRTLFPSVRWPTPWRSPREDAATATASAAPGPVGYLVNHPAGLSGAHGIGYDYVLGSGGVYVQSESAHLTARVHCRSLRGAGARSR